MNKNLLNNKLLKFFKSIHKFCTEKYIYNLTTILLNYSYLCKYLYMFPNKEKSIFFY